MSRDRNRRSDASGPKPIGSFGDQDRKRVLDYLSSRSLGEDIALQETCRRIACRTTTMRSLQFSSKCQSERRIHLRRLLPLRGFSNRSRGGGRFFTTPQRVPTALGKSPHPQTAREEAANSHVRFLHLAVWADPADASRDERQSSTVDCRTG